jgi:hypothetical protein
LDAEYVPQQDIQQPVASNSIRLRLMRTNPAHPPTAPAPHCRPSPSRYPGPCFPSSSSPSRFLVCDALTTLVYF